MMRKVIAPHLYRHLVLTTDQLIRLDQKFTVSVCDGPYRLYETPLRYTRSYTILEQHPTFATSLFSGQSAGESTDLEEFAAIRARLEFSLDLINHALSKMKDIYDGDIDEHPDVKPHHPITVAIRDAEGNIIGLDEEMWTMRSCISNMDGEKDKYPYGLGRQRVRETMEEIAKVALLMIGWIRSAGIKEICLESWSPSIPMIIGNDCVPGEEDISWSRTKMPNTTIYFHSRFWQQYLTFRIPQCCQIILLDDNPNFEDEDLDQIHGEDWHGHNDLRKAIRAVIYKRSKQARHSSEALVFIVRTIGTKVEKYKRAIENARESIKERRDEASGIEYGARDEWKVELIDGTNACPCCAKRPTIGMGEWRMIDYEMEEIGPFPEIVY